MDAMAARTQVTNGRVAEDLGISESMVSRIRSGDRQPSTELMVKIREVYQWDVTYQAIACVQGTADQTYAHQFERVLADHYGNTQ